MCTTTTQTYLFIYINSHNLLLMTNQPKALPGTAALLGYFLQDVLRGQHLADNPASYEAGRIHSLGQLTVWLQLASWAAGQMTEALSSTSFKSTSCGNQKSKCKHQVVRELLIRKMQLTYGLLP